MDKYMSEAIKESYTGITKGHGGPFGAVVVKDGVIIGKGHNCVLKENDPTAHGEVLAIRDACKTIKSYNLSGASLYTTSEPCPMCLSASLWAGIDKIYYGANRHDAEDIGFRDSLFYDMLSGKKPMPDMREISRDECLKLFKEFNEKQNKKIY